MAQAPGASSNPGVPDTTPLPASPPSVLCLLNPHAAGGRGAALREPLARALQAHPEVPLIVPGDAADARASLMRLAPGSRVIVAGGDGTVHQLLPALHARQLELALLPCGTGNDLAKALGLRHLHWRAALRHGLSAPAARMDLGRVQIEQREHLFMSSLTAGFDAAVGARAHAAPGWLRGMPRYLWATLAEIRHLRLYDVQIRADDHLLHEGQVLFASSLNTASYASGMPVAPGARIDDGLLELVRAGRFGRLGALAAMPLLLTGQHLRHPKIALQRFAQLNIRSATPIPLALDGEPIADASEFSVRVLPLALAVVASLDRCRPQAADASPVSGSL